MTLYTSTRRPGPRRFGALLFLAAGCTGTIAGAPQEPVLEEPGTQPTRPNGTGGRTPMNKPPEVARPPETPAADLPAPDARLVRLTHEQWENTTRDLLFLDGPSGLSGTFTPDAENTAAKLVVDQGQWGRYQRAAEELASRAVRDERIFTTLVPSGPSDVGARARAFISTFARRAYRRPLAPGEIDALAALFARGPELVGGADPIRAGVELVIQTVLQSPHFLYRIELSTKVVGSLIPLDDYEIASKLSYALIASMPDEALFAAAASGDLRQPAGVRREVARLLATPPGSKTLASFHAHLLELEHYDAIDKSKQQFPQFVPQMATDMHAEAAALIEDVVIKGRGGIAGLLDARHTFVNKRLATLYGLSGTFGEELQKVDLDARQRRGFLTTSGFLAANADGANPSSIRRGVFLAMRILCKNLPPPVDNIALPDPDPTWTNRERIDKATGKGTCGEACHGILINPAGFAFEHYDGLGQYRTTDNNKTVDAAGAYPIDGASRRFTDALELAGLLTNSQEVQACYVRHLLEHASGREVRADEGAVVQALAERARGGALGAQDILIELTSRPEFLGRRPEAQEVSR